MKIIGAIIGAISAPILLVFFVMLVSGRPAPDNWDWVTPALTLAALPVVCIAGAVAGAKIVDARRRGDTQRVQMLAGGALAIILFLPAWILEIRMTPTPPAQPATAAEVEAWAQSLTSGTGSYNFTEFNATALARRLQRCSPTNKSDCESEMDTFYGDGEDSLVAKFAYGIHDQGWRWTKEQGKIRRFTIFPDPRLKRKGPVFEVWGPDILRHETRGAPATYPDSGVARRLAFPQCIADFAREAAERGTWDRTAASLPRLIADGWSPPTGCPGVVLNRVPDDEVPAYGVRSDWEFSLVGPGVDHTRFRLWPDTSNASTPFAYSFASGERHFSREPNGTWTTGSKWDGGYPGPEVPACFFQVGTVCPEITPEP